MPKIRPRRTGRTRARDGCDDPPLSAGRPPTPAGPLLVATPAVTTPPVTRSASLVRATSYGSGHPGRGRPAAPRLSTGGSCPQVRRSRLPDPPRPAIPSAAPSIQGQVGVAPHGPSG